MQNKWMHETTWTFTAASTCFSVRPLWRAMTTLKGRREWKCSFTVSLSSSSRCSSSLPTTKIVFVLCHLCEPSQTMCKWQGLNDLKRDGSSCGSAGQRDKSLLTIYETTDPHFVMCLLFLLVNKNVENLNCVAAMYWYNDMQWNDFSRNSSFPNLM